MSGRIERLFIANRGEVAVRVARTCARLGVVSVAAVTADDRGSLHARMADGVREVGSYLDAGGLVEAAVEAGADAVHPGWGFLAESPALAEAVSAAGLVWVGPPASAMRLAADKLEAKRIAAGVEVPTLPTGTAEEVGLPLVVKAAAGGGGRGMRAVRERDELEPALAAARREALAAFGDDRVFCERLVEGARHVEVQLLADGHGAVQALGERDCSIQRRHQKVLEETPSPGLAASAGTTIAASAVALARAVSYKGAGTAEFLVAGDGFWFIELNARLQVEHPVTELVTGLDLVEQQLRIAAGEPLDAAPEARGHAVEVRLYAEHPLTFLPQDGLLERLRFPDTSSRRSRRRGGRPRAGCLRPLAREARRGRRDARRGLRRARRCPARDRGRRRRDEPPLPALAGGPPRRACRRGDHGLSRPPPTPAAAPLGPGGVLRVVESGPRPHRPAARAPRRPPRSSPAPTRRLRAARRASSRPRCRAWCCRCSWPKATASRHGSRWPCSRR